MDAIGGARPRASRLRDIGQRDPQVGTPPFHDAEQVTFRAPDVEHAPTRWREVTHEACHLLVYAPALGGEVPLVRVRRFEVLANDGPRQPNVRVGESTTLAETQSCQRTVEALLPEVTRPF